MRMTLAGGSAMLVTALILVSTSSYCVPTAAAQDGDEHHHHERLTFTAFVHGTEAEFQSKWNSSLHLNATRVKITSFNTYLGPFGIHMGTAKFHIDGDGVFCDRNATLAPSSNRSWLDPCVTWHEFDMSLLGWHEIQEVLMVMEPMYLMHHLSISELWSNASHLPSGPSSATKWNWRLHADHHGGVEEPRAGRVELQPGSGAMWGTVCFEAIPFELAVALCNTIFPGTTNAKSYRADGGRGFIAAHNLHHHNSIVNASLSSQTHKDNLCTHRNDLGLVCGTNVTQAPHGYNQDEVAIFHLAHGGLIDWKIEMATVGAIPPGSISHIHTHHHTSFENHTVHFNSSTHYDGNVTFMLLGDAGFTGRDMDWILQHTNRWVLNDTEISHLSSSVPTEPRFFEHETHDLGRASFEVALHVFEAELWHLLDHALVSNSVRFIQCENDTHTLNTVKVEVHTCHVDFVNEIEAKKAVDSANLQELHDVYAAIQHIPSSNTGTVTLSPSSPSSSGTSGGTVAAIVISVLVVVGLASVALVLHRRRTARTKSASTVNVGNHDIDEQMLTSVNTEDA